MKIINNVDDFKSLKSIDLEDIKKEEDLDNVKLLKDILKEILKEKNKYKKE